MFANNYSHRNSLTYLNGQDGALENQKFKLVPHEWFLSLTEM